MAPSHLRVVHVVGKSAVENMALLRFASNLAEHAVQRGWESEAWTVGRSDATSGFREFNGKTALLRHLASVRPAIVHVHAIWDPVNTMVMAACGWLGIPFVVSPSGMLMPVAIARSARKKALYWRMFEKAILEGAAAFHATTEEEAASIRSRIPAARVFTVPLPVQAPAPPGMRPRVAGRVLFLGRLHPIKNVEQLLAAFAGAPPGWKLVMAGDGDPAYVARLKQHARSLPAGAVEFTGWLDGVARERELEGAMVLVLPSASENFGMVVLEALARGTPVVASRGTPWRVLDESGAGRWVEGDAPGIRRALDELLVGGSVWASASDAARHVARGFGWDTLWPRYQEIYRSVGGRE